MNEDALAALQTFLRRAFAGRRAERYAALVSTKRGRATFCHDLHHAIGEVFSPECIVAELPASMWSEAAFRFSGGGEFGSPVPSLREAFAVNDEAVLCITRDGKAAAYRPETFVDGERLIETPS